MKFCGLTTCEECPWRKDVEPGQFPPERFELLSGTVGPEDGFRPIFACHKSRDGEELACVGYLMRYAYNNLHCRLAMSRGELNVKLLVATGPLYETYEQMAAANGAHCESQSQPDHYGTSPSSPDK